MRLALALALGVAGFAGTSTMAAPPAQNDLLHYRLGTLEKAVGDLEKTFGVEYPRATEFLERARALRQRVDAHAAAGPTASGELEASLAALQQEALLANPLLHSHQLLLVKRRPSGKGGEPGLNIAMPSNHECNSSLPRTGYDNELGVLSPISPKGELRTLYRPPDGGYVGEVDLHWAADRLLFTQADATNWKVFELRADGSGLRQVSTMPNDVDSFDACYLPSGKILFGSTASSQSVPCWHGQKKVSNLYLMNADGSGVRQVCFDQDHDLHPTVLPNGQVLYNRWDYTGINHIYLRELMLMNPDGTGQRAIYGSGSWFPNSLYFARPLPGDAGKLISILSGYHGPHRMGQLVILDTAKGWQEAEGIVQRISGRGEPVRPLVKDNLIGGDWPKFLHPFPLSEKYFLVAAWLNAQSNWGIYLADVFDNLVRGREEPGWALLEPVLLKSQPKPPVMPEQVDLSRDDGLVYLHDVHVGPGLAGVPRGAVKSLRVLAYHFGYLGLAGPDLIGYGGPWEVMRILGTVPMEADGSAFFRVPARTPIALQPLDAEGKAVQLMRSWFTVMPGEKASCIGCHEPPSDTPRPQAALAARREPRALTPWHGPARGFDFEREVQPVLDRHCVKCHDGTSPSGRADSQTAEAAPDSAPRGIQRVASPLTPALAPLRGEGDAMNARGDSSERRREGGFSSNSAESPSAADGLPDSDAARRAPSPLNGERAGVRGENALQTSDLTAPALHAPPDLRSLALVTNYVGRRISELGVKRLHPQMRSDTQGLLKYTPAYDALLPYIRRVGIEDDVSLLTPGEYHADTSPLIQMLRQGHYGVQFDAEDWDRLVTWIDLNAPCHGTWGEVYPIPDGAHERRMALRRQFGGPKEDPEDIPKAEEARADERTRTSNPRLRQIIAEKGNHSEASPLTPALSPLRGEGDAMNVRGDSSGRRREVGFTSNSAASPSAADGLPDSDAARRAPSPLNGERAGVRGETVPKSQRLPRPVIVSRVSDMPSGPREKVIELDHSITLKLVRIPAGELIESTVAEPASRITIASSFWMAACEISNEQFRQFDSTHDSRYYQKRYPAGEPGTPDWVGPDARGLTLNGDRQPVVRVSWEKAMAFCRWLSARTGRRFTLPTEAQWEWACRAGTTTPFSFGERDADFSRWANLADRSFRRGLGKDGKQSTGGLEHLLLEGAALSDQRCDDRTVVTADIGSFQPNAWGLHDLHGNAAEWTRDDDADGRKIVRGGSFFDPPTRSTSTARVAYPPWQRVFNVGFRVVCEDGGAARGDQ